MPLLHQFYITLIQQLETIRSSLWLELKADALLDGTQVREWNPRTVMNSEYSWKGLYDIIFESNLLLDNIYRTQGLTTERENYHKGQAESA